MSELPPARPSDHAKSDSAKSDHVEGDPAEPRAGNLTGASVPLAQSPLWQRQQEFYTRLGEHAWQSGFVPEYITSNPFIAHAYARMVLAYWRDCAAQVDARQPCYIVELGAGSGRFAFLFLQTLQDLAQNALEAQQPRFVYVMTDVAQSNLDAWQANSKLAPFVEAGVLDFARFDAICDSELALLRSGVRLAPPSTTSGAGSRAGVNPGVVIANYVFDTIPNDLYYVRDGVVFERRIALESNVLESAAAESSDGRTGMDAEIVLRHSHHRLDLDSLDDPIQAALLQRHADRLDGTVFPLPTVACDVCGRLRTLFGEQVMLLVGDKGYLTWAELQAVGDAEKPVPGLAFHSGGFSVMVNFPALAHYTELTGGVACVPAHEAHRLGVAALLFGKGASGDAASREAANWPATRAAFATHVEEFGPDDFYVMTRALDAQLATLPWHQVLALLRLSRWDPQLMADCLPAVAAALDDLTPGAWQALDAAIARTLAHDYLPTARYDLAYGLGRLFYQRGDYARALPLLQRAHEQRAAGTQANTQMRYEIAACLVEVGETGAAAATLAEVLAAAPGHAAARDLAAYLRRKSRTE